MKKKLFLGAWVMVVLAISSCTKEEPPPMNPVESPVTIAFSHKVGSADVEYNVIKYLNDFGNLYSVATLKYFMSDLRLVRDDGSEVPLTGIHYVDGMDPTTLVLDPDVKIPRGEYSGISFTFGLSKGNNITGQFPNPPENNMEWPVPLGGGYHYMKLEGKIDHPGGAANFQAHTGPTAGNDNSIAVKITGVEFVSDGQDIRLVLVMDINRWWSGPNTLDLNTMTMVMGNQEMQQKLHDNGWDVFTLETD